MISLRQALSSLHPQAKKIPEWVGIFIFNIYLDDDEECRMIRRMTGSLSEVNFPLTPEENPLWSLLYVAYAHNEANDEELILAARQMGVPEKKIAEAGMILARPQLFKNNLINQEQLINIIAEDDFLLCFLALCMKHFDLFNDFVSLLNPENRWKMITAAGYRILESPSLKDQLFNFDHLISSFEPRLLFEKMVEDDFKIIQLVASSANELIFNKLIKISAAALGLQEPQALKKVLAFKEYQLFASAVIKGCSTSFNFLYKLLPPEDLRAMINAGDFQVFHQAAKNSNLGIVRLLLNETDEMTRRAMLAEDNFFAFRSAIKKSDLIFFELLIDAAKEPSLRADMLKAGCIAGFSYIITTKQFHFIRRMIELAPQHIDSLRIGNHNRWWTKNCLSFFHFLIEHLYTQWDDLLLAKKETKSLVNLKIISPKLDCIYHYACPELPEGRLTISYGGSSLPKMNDICVNSLNHSWNSNIYLPNPVSYESKETLPLYFSDSKIPLFLYDYSHCQLRVVTKLHIYNNDIIISDSTEFTGHKALEIINPTLMQECQQLVGNIPINMGNHPIFKVYNRPNFTWLAELYEKFWQYNKDKLEDQYSKTAGRCFVRAHFISMMLSIYGVDSVKIFKFWEDDTDWEAYGWSESWIFHCAVMIIDSDNDKWVWDPWVGLNAQLLSLPQWLYDQTMPAPIELMIQNRGSLSFTGLSGPFLSSHTNSGVIPNLAFDCKVSAESRRFFQALCGSAIPNPPQQPRLRLSTYNPHFFSRRQRAITSADSSCIQDLPVSANDTVLGPHV